MDNLEKFKQEHLAAIQKKELEILCAVRDICERHNIDYWLDGGTCLGAVRHGGFIPWDDDIDIAMRKEDMERFVQIAKKELPEGMFLQNKETDPTFTPPMVKVRYTNSILVEFGDDFRLPYNKGLYIDIFPFIPYPNISRKACKAITRGYCRANSILHKQHTYSWRSAAELFWFGAKRVCCLAAWKAIYLFADKSKYYGCAIESNGYGIMHETSNLFPTKPITFEGETMRGPANPDAYLKTQYGDYMQLPPEDQRRVHAAFFLEKLL